jgi:hypothetical protein
MIPTLASYSLQRQKIDPGKILSTNHLVMDGQVFVMTRYEKNTRHRIVVGLVLFCFAIDSCYSFAHDFLLSLVGL